MSERKDDLRRRVLVNRRPKPPPLHPSTKLPTHRRSRRRSIKRVVENNVGVMLRRCKSEPVLLTTLDFNSSVRGDDLTPQPYDDDDDDVVVLYRPLTCADIFSPPELLLALSPQKFEGYNKDSKVVVNVTVDGSPGPVRAMVKLGSSVDETIRLVMRRYDEEGRTPRLSKESSSGFELHHSHFSLESLDKSSMIGDVGSRSFYMRKSNSSKEDDVVVKPNNPTPADLFLQAFNFLRIRKIIRKTKKLWKILGCLQSS